MKNVKLSNSLEYVEAIACAVALHPHLIKLGISILNLGKVSNFEQRKKEYIKLLCQNFDDLIDAQIFDYTFDEFTNIQKLITKCFNNDTFEETIADYIINENFSNIFDSEVSLNKIGFVKLIPVQKSKFLPNTSFIVFVCSDNDFEIPASQLECCIDEEFEISELDGKEKEQYQRFFDESIKGEYTELHKVISELNPTFNLEMFNLIDQNVPIFNYIAYAEDGLLSIGIKCNEDFGDGAILDEEGKYFTYIYAVPNEGIELNENLGGLYAIWNGPLGENGWTVTADNGFQEFVELVLN